MNNIVVDNIEIEVVKKNIKNMNLSVSRPEGRVRISIPNNIDEEIAKKFIISKLEWIKKHRKAIKSQDIECPKEFISGESHYLFGHSYTLNVIETKSKQRVELIDGFINLYISPNTNKEKREKIMREWYRINLKEIIPNYIQKWEKIIGLSVNEWSVKLMKTRWGTCNIKAKRIWINLELAKKDPKFLDYIVVHEMVHLLERYHNDNFKSHMDKYLEDWREVQDELNGLA